MGLDKNRSTEEGSHTSKKGRIWVNKRIRWQNEQVKGKIVRDT